MKKNIFECVNGADEPSRYNLFDFAPFSWQNCKNKSGKKVFFFHSLSFGLKTPIRFCYHTFAEIGLKHRVKPNISQKQIAGKLHIRWKLSKYINISKNSNNFNSSKSRDKKCRNIWAVFLISVFCAFFFEKSAQNSNSDFIHTLKLNSNWTH